MVSGCIIVWAIGNITADDGSITIIDTKCFRERK